MLNILAIIGRYFLNFLKYIGIVFEYLLLSTIKILIPPYYFKNFLVQIIEIGFFSLPIVALTALFSGMVLALQAFTSFTLLPSESIIANIVAVALTRELAPVLTALMVAGRISSSISAEIGTMRVTEQLDVLYSLSINPLKFLIAPKVIAGVICLPILILLADFIGVIGGYLVATFKLGFNGITYLNASYSFITFYDIISGLVKGLCFGFILTSMGCFFGYNTTNGAQGVGKAVTYSVASSSILIFLLDYLLTILFFGIR